MTEEQLPPEPGSAPDMSHGLPIDNDQVLPATPEPPTDDQQIGDEEYPDDDDDS